MRTIAFILVIVVVAAAAYYFGTKNKLPGAKFVPGQKVIKGPTTTTQAPTLTH